MMEKAEIVAAIRRAARELGRTPSRGELKRLTGVSHYRVLTQFRSLREAGRAAGLGPRSKGERVSTEELMKDWERVRKKLGRRPSRAEYVREGKFSAGSFVGRFGAWSRISTTEGTEEHRGKSKSSSRKLTRKTRIAQNHHNATESDKAIAFQWARSLAAIPGPLAGKRRVTEAVAAMMVGTLRSKQQLAISNWPKPKRVYHRGHGGAQRNWYFAAAARHLQGPAGDGAAVCPASADQCARERDGRGVPVCAGGVGPGIPGGGAVGEISGWARETAGGAGREGGWMDRVCV